jgi:endonuclease/exonuclease/phosphatase (EEP) superfamily protein YafD
MRIAFFAISFLLTASVSGGPTPDSGSSFTVLSWNVSQNAFVSHRPEFQALLNHAAPDIVLLDEVDPSTNPAQLQAALPFRKTGSDQGLADKPWHISFGTSGGRQRGVIASRMPLEELPEFAEILPYPDEARRRIMQRMSANDRVRHRRLMDSGIAVNGAIILFGSRRLLVVIADLECCGDDPASWAELKRREEAKEIRSAIRRVVGRTPVDGIVLAGDFNLVSTAIPLVLMTGPYPAPHPGLIAAELYHGDGVATWTWDGRGTPFPSRALDYQLYSPNTLRLLQGQVLDTEDLTTTLLEMSGLQADWSAKLSSHRPLVVEYEWN